jgi:hypothetical protein
MRLALTLTPNKIRGKGQYVTGAVAGTSIRTPKKKVRVPVPVQVPGTRVRKSLPMQKEKSLHAHGFSMVSGSR